MTTHLTKVKTVSKNIKSVKLYRLRCAIHLLDEAGNRVGEVGLDLEGDKIPVAVTNEIEEIQREAEEAKADE